MSGTTEVFARVKIDVLLTPGPGVGPGADPAPVVVGSLAHFRERDQLGAAEAEIAARAVDREALHPGLAVAAGTGLDEQVQAVAVAVAPEPVGGLDRAHERRGEAVHGALPASACACAAR